MRGQIQNCGLIIMRETRFFLDFPSRFLGFVDPWCAARKVLRSERMAVGGSRSVSYLVNLNASAITEYDRNIDSPGSSVGFHYAINRDVPFSRSSMFIPCLRSGPSKLGTAVTLNKLVGV